METTKLAFTIKGHNSRTIKGIITKFEFDLCIVVKKKHCQKFKMICFKQNLRIGINRQMKELCSRTEKVLKSPKSDLAYTWRGIKTNNILGVHFFCTGNHFLF